MAIDGVKIIDSDSAYDVYNPIMEMYHFGETMEKIKTEMDSQESHFLYSELEYEIYTTAYALAMWEIGGLANEQLQNVRSIVSKGASILWNDIAPNAVKDRQKVLDKFLRKIEQPNLKVKKRKNYKQATEFLFLPEDVFTIRFEDKTFRAAILIMTFQEGKTLYYAFAELLLDEITLNLKEKPTLEEVIWFSKVRARINLGFDSIKIVSHKKLLRFKDKFEKVGSVKIKQNVKMLGSMSGGVDSFEEFCDKWDDGKGKMKNLHDLLELD